MVVTIRGNSTTFYLSSILMLASLLFADDISNHFSSRDDGANTDRDKIQVL